MRYWATPNCATLGHSELLWPTMGYSGLLWATLGYSGLLWTTSIINKSLIQNEKSRANTYPPDYLRILRIPCGYNMIFAWKYKNYEAISFMLTVAEIVVGFETLCFLRHHLTLKDFPPSSLLRDNCRFWWVNNNWMDSYKLPPRW